MIQNNFDETFDSTMSQNMRYINKEDLLSVIQQRFLDDSSANIAGDDAILFDLEQKAIDYVISYLSGRYNTDLIFATDAPLRNGVLCQIIAQIIVYRAVRRNAARKVSDDYVNMFNEATKMLERIQSGAMSLVSLPLINTADGSSAPVLSGNNRNSDYFI
jgi:phage gp36-like protein